MLSALPGKGDFFSPRAFEAEPRAERILSCLAWHISPLKEALDGFATERGSRRGRKKGQRTSSRDAEQLGGDAKDDQ